jgi:serine/threonine protein kinase
LSGRLQGTDYRIERASTVVGRGPGVDLAFDDETLSRQHASLEFANCGYEVEREIGRGGMGVVLLARPPALDRAVVLKSLRRECADDPRLVARFEREAQEAGSVQHQNVVAVHDCFGWRGRSYICQKYVDGTHS